VAMRSKMLPPTTPAATAPDTTEVAQSRSAGTKYAVEAIGTFFLVFTIGASVRSGSSLAPLAIGAVLMVMIYAGGHISGGHYNPAVTLAVLVRRRIELRDAIGYWIVQVGAGLLAAEAVRAVRPGHVNPLTLSEPAVVAAFVAELLFTFALCYVVLNVATSKDHPDNSFYGLAIGFTVLAGAVAVGGISGAPSTRPSSSAVRRWTCSPCRRCGSIWWRSSSPAPPRGSCSAHSIPTTNRTGQYPHLWMNP
jgi:aquaporin Z